MHERKKCLRQFHKITLRSVTRHQTPCMYIHFLKWAVCNHGGSTEATRGCGTVSHVFLPGWSACLSLIFCEFLVGASRFVVGALHQLAPLWLRTSLALRTWWSPQPTVPVSRQRAEHIHSLSVAQRGPRLLARPCWHQTITGHTSPRWDFGCVFSLLSIDFKHVIAYEEWRGYHGRCRDWVRGSTTKESWFACRQVSTKGFRPSLGPTRPPIRRLPWTFSRVKAVRHFNLSTPSGIEVENEWSYISLVLWLHGVHRDNFVLTFVLY
jgi:hypothetical protein